MPLDLLQLPVRGPGHGMVLALRGYGVAMNTRTIALVALIIAVIVLVILLT